MSKPSGNSHANPFLNCDPEMIAKRIADLMDNQDSWSTAAERMRRKIYEAAAAEAKKESEAIEQHAPAERHSDPDSGRI